MFLGIIDKGELANTATAYLPTPLRRLLQIITLVCVLIVVIPTGYLVVWAVFGTEIPGELASTPTLQWFSQLLSDGRWQDSLMFSTTMAAGVTCAGAVLATWVAYFTYSASPWAVNITFGMMTAALLTPVIPYGMSLRLLSSTFHVPEWLALAIGHLVIVMPIQYFILRATQERVTKELIWSGQTLGASHLRNILGVFIPLNRDAIIATLVFGFFVSFDEVVVASFVIVSAMVTAPLRLWQSGSHTVQPDPAVVSTLLLIATMGVSVVQMRRKRLDEIAPPVGAGSLKLLLGWSREAFIGAGVSAATWLWLHFTGATAGESLKALMSLGVGALCSLSLGLWKARRCLGPILKQVNPDGLSGIPQRFGYETIRAIARRTDLLRAGTWTDVSAEENSIFAAIAFASNRKLYIGTDRNVPSRYSGLYPNYLNNQFKGHADRIDLRIVLYTIADLREDYESHPHDVTRFIRSHYVPGTMLLSVDWDLARRSAHTHGLLSPDVAIFDWRYVVFFEPPSDRALGRICMQVIDSTLRESLKNYLSVLLDHAVEIHLDGDKPAVRTVSFEARRHCEQKYLLLRDTSWRNSA